MHPINTIHAKTSLGPKIQLQKLSFGLHVYLYRMDFSPSRTFPKSVLRLLPVRVMKPAWIRSVLVHYCPYPGSFLILDWENGLGIRPILA